MSHFTVVVIGPDVDKQLSPYDEELRVAPYKKFLDDEEVKRMADYYATHDLTELVARMNDWSGNTGGVEDGKLYYMSTYNPNSKWDWHVVGGRWTGFFKAKKDADVRRLGVGEPGLMSRPIQPGCYDIIRVGDVDFDGMREVARTKATEEWNKYAWLVGDLQLPQPWREFMKDYSDISDARKAYAELPIVKILTCAHMMPFSEDIADIYSGGCQAMVKRAESTVGVPYAMVRDGKWQGKGDMGWFGMSDDKHTDADWDKMVHDLYQSLPRDTVLTLVDCHI